jgi:hypothetical protein
MKLICAERNRNAECGRSHETGRSRDTTRPSATTPSFFAKLNGDNR